MNHFVNGNSIKAPFPKECEQVVFALGCFWGAERQFWQQKGVYTTAVGLYWWAYRKSHLQRSLYWFNGSC
jgi:peptide methionine sulfoxide reductase MsrA